jgi:hypothetical protein
MWGLKGLLISGLWISSALSQSTQGIYDLVQRRIPQHADNFQFALVNFTDQGYDQYIVSSLPNGTVLVEGNTLSALSHGYAFRSIATLRPRLINPIQAPSLSCRCGAC